LAEETSYQIAIASPAEKRYQEIVLAYLVTYYSIKRAAEIDRAISKTVYSLVINPLRGSNEYFLSKANQDFRFILYRENRNFEIKIIYFVDEEQKRVFITDFFPTKMHPQKMKK
jgi:hypothetical protein